MRNSGETSRSIHSKKKVRRIFFCCVALLLYWDGISLAGDVPGEILSPPVKSSSLFPCSDCHAPGRALQKEKLHKSSNIHPGQDYSCFSCHDKEQSDMLILFNGEKVELLHSSRLCGQCHSTTYHLWQSGLHGKILGKWNGRIKITPCTGCHNPHQPAYQAQKPEPPPTPPRKTLRWGS